MRQTMIAALLWAALAGVAAAQRTAAPRSPFDGGGGLTVQGILRQAREGRAESPGLGAVREVRTGFDIRIEIGDPFQGRGRWQARNPWRWERVQELAHEVEERAEHLHRAAEERRHHDGYREERFFEACHAFEESTRHFHRQVEGYRQEPSHTRSDYYELLEAFRQVEWTISSAHVESHVWGDFNAARSALSQLEFFYQGSWYDGGHDGRHGGGHGDDDDWPYRRRRPHGRHR